MIFARGDDNLFGSQRLGVMFGAISVGLVLIAVWRAVHGQWGLLAGVVVVVGTIGFVLGVNALVERVDVRRGERASVPYHACPPTACSPAGVRAVVPSAPVPAPGSAAHGRGSGLQPASARMVRAVRDTPTSDGGARMSDGLTPTGPAFPDASLTAPIVEVSS